MGDSVVISLSLNQQQGVFGGRCCGVVCLWLAELLLSSIWMDDVFAGAGVGGAGGHCILETHAN